MNCLNCYNQLQKRCICESKWFPPLPKKIIKKYKIVLHSADKNFLQYVNISKFTTSFNIGFISQWFTLDTSQPSKKAQF